MNYKKEKIEKARKAINEVRKLSEIFCPTDSWLSEERAIEANKQWQEMMKCLDKIGVELAKEKAECQN